MRRIESTPLTWSRRERLRYLETLVFWRGSVRRADLIARFDIGPQRVSADIQEYLRLNPGALTYDRNEKTYVASPSMQPVMGEPRLEDALALFGDRPEQFGPWVDRVALPTRRVNLAAVQHLFRAVVQGKSVRIRYASLHSGTFRWRWITPHAFAFDGYRWHARAYCHEEKSFKDFVLGRIAETGPLGEPESSPAADSEWASVSHLRLVPAPGMNEAEIRALQLDFGLRERHLTVPVRSALRLYALAQLGLQPNGAPFPSRWRLETDKV